MTTKVKYQIATYSGTVSVPCDENDENEHIIAKAKRIINLKSGPLPFGHESWKVISRH
jgi:hypothetical protein